MDLEAIKAAALAEVTERNFAHTQQILAVHSVVFENGIPVVARVITANANPVVYFPINGERFFFAVYLETSPLVQACWVGIEPGAFVYVRMGRPAADVLATLSFEVTPIKEHSICIKLEEYEPDDVDRKIDRLLSYLEEKQDEIKLLTKDNYAVLQIAYYGHVESMWGIHLENKTIKKLADLNIEFDLDLYAGGNPFKD